MIETINSNSFRTKNFYLAVFLLSRGVNMEDIEESEKKDKFIFLFPWTQEVDGLIKAFNFSLKGDSSVLVDPREFANNIRSLKEKIHYDVN